MTEADFTRKGATTHTAEHNAEIRAGLRVDESDFFSADGKPVRRIGKTGGAVASL